MKDFLCVRILDKFRKVFEKSGVNYDVMRKLLQIKFTLDSRRQSFNNGNNANNQKKNKERNYFRASLLGYGITGIFIAMIMLYDFPVMYRYGIGLGIMIVMLSVSMISDFTSVLLDLREKALLGSKPIDDKTANMAKLIHIAVYQFMITSVFAGPALVVSIIKDGIAVGLTFLVLVILSNFSIILFTSLFYLVFLKFFSGDKLKDIVNYVQIGLSIMIFVMYQFVGRAYEILGVNIIFEFKWWQFFVPSLVFAAPIELISGGEANAINVAFTVWTILLPFISVLLYVKVVVPNFEKNLFKMNSVEKKKVKKDVAGERKGSRNSDFIARIICRDRQERAVYLFARNMIKRDRKFKQAVYPSMAMGVFFPFIMMFSTSRGMGIKTYLEGFVEHGRYLHIYMGFMMICPLILMVAYSDKYKGAWIYDILPIKDRTVIKKGVFKSFMIKFYYSIFFAQALLFTFIGGPKVLVMLIPAFFVMNIFSMVCFATMKLERPFSTGYGTSNAKNAGMTFLLAMIAGVFWVVNFFIIRMEYGNLILSLTLGCLTFVTWKIVFRKRETSRKKAVKA